MAAADHYIFMDGCVVKGCKPVLEFEHTFGEYAYLLEDLYRRGGWEPRRRRIAGLLLPGNGFDGWADRHVLMAQSTQNLRTGAMRIDAMLHKIDGEADIHLFGTSAAGSAILEYFLLTDPETLYFHATDPRDRRMPARKYRIDRRIASVTCIDAPNNWVPLRRESPMPGANGAPGTLGRYLAEHTRVKAGPRYPEDEYTIRTEDVPGTWVGAKPVAGAGYDNHPHFDHLPDTPLERHIYTGSHMSDETRAFLERVWR